MPRSIWKGSISFGLVTVPVKVYSAAKSHTVRFHQLHEEDGVRIQQRRVCPSPDHGEGGAEVAYEDIVSGYEIAPGQYVRIEPDELRALDPKATRTIDIEDFVDLADIDPVYYDKPYYLVPEQVGHKPYKLLLEAMRRSGKVAIARVVLRTKQYLTAIRPSGDVLIMETMLWHDEVVDKNTLDDELPGDDVSARDREIKMAEQLIETLTADFEPDKYHDEYRERVMELIEKKAAGEEIVVQPDEEPAPVVDIMAALEASLAAATAGAQKRDGSKDDGKGDAKPKRAASRSTKSKSKSKAA